MNRNWKDITVPIRNGMPCWPEDPPVDVHRRLSIEGGNDFNISSLSMSSHTGTHMDAPLHFIPGAPGLEEMPLETTIGPARIIEISGAPSIGTGELSGCGIEPGQRILFKTANSNGNWPELPFLEDYVYLAAEAARFLAEKKVACVGIDYLSIAELGPGAVDTHVALLEAGVYIIEGLYLAGVEPGDYEMVCLPLFLQDADGAPARAIIRPL